MWNYVMFDCETGGLSHIENPITEIAFLVYDCVNFEEKYRFETFVKPYNNLKLEKKALEITGINEKMLEKGVTYKNIVEAFILISEKFTIKNGRRKTKPILVGHNIAEFDVLFIEKIFSLCGKNLFDYYQRYLEDTLILSRSKWVDDYKKFNLSSCCEYAGVEVIDAHRAMNDVEPNKLLHEYLIKSLRLKNIKKDNLNTDNNNHRKNFKF